MSMTAEQYIAHVIALMPRAGLRAQVAMELRGHFAERVAGGQTVDEVIKQLGDPATLADSYLSAEPLHNAHALARIAAKVLDFLIVFTALLPIALAIGFLTGSRMGVSLGLIFWLLGGSFGFVLYTVVAEAQYGRTLGKKIMRLRVVRESGARISFGQAIVRQLPVMFQVAWLDAAFALFTEKNQRAVELLSKTRTIDASQEVQ